MTKYEIRCLQARCAALGFSPGPIDGLMGARTRSAHDEARRSQDRLRLPFVHPSGITRLHIHWTGGTHSISVDDRKSYNEVITGPGELVKLAPLEVRRNHTLNANGQATSISLCAMGGNDVRERPLVWGKWPITQAQLITLYRRCAEISREYDIPVSPFSMLTHAEVWSTLGVPQKNKWDITCLPGMSRVGDARTVGDMIREGIRGRMV